MARKRFKDEEVLNLLRQIEVDLSSGSDVAKCVLQGGHQRCDLLYMAQKVRWNGKVAITGKEGIGERKPAVEKDRCGP